MHVHLNVKFIIVSIIIILCPYWRDTIDVPPGIKWLQFETDHFPHLVLNLSAKNNDKLSALQQKLTWDFDTSLLEDNCVYKHQFG